MDFKEAIEAVKQGHYVSIPGFSWGLLFGTASPAYSACVPAELLKEALIKQGYTEAERFEIQPKPMTLEEEVIMLRAKVKELEQAKEPLVTWDTHELIYQQSYEDSVFLSSFSRGRAANSQGLLSPEEALRQASLIHPDGIYSFRKKEN